ncbi:unnamed protein product [Agarophyton chilense]
MSFITFREGHNELDVERKPFSEGSTRWAFKGIVREGEIKGFGEGTNVVLKVIKPEAYSSGIRIEEEDITIQKTTSELCYIFNGEGYLFNMEDHQVTKLYARIGKLILVDGDFCGNFRQYLRRGEKILIEEMIRGEYDVFNTDWGASRGHFKIPDFFSHWSWYSTSGLILVCDLQGHRGRPGGPKIDGSTEYFMFTDPIVLTKTANGILGYHDSGAEGIRNWFDIHHCNSLCIEYGLETEKPKTGKRFSLMALRHVGQETLFS